MCFNAIYQATLRSGRVSNPLPPVAVLAALLYFGTTSAAIPSPQSVTIGVLNYLGSEKTVDHWAATVETLNQALPDVRFRLAPLDHAGMRAALAADDLEFVITNPGNYAELEYAFHISRIATTEESTPVASTLVTTRSDLNALTDLSGHRLAAVSEDAFGGFQVIWRELQDAGLRPGHNLEVLMTGLPMQKVADAVLSGQADAGVLRACMLEEMQAADPTRYGALRAFGVRSTPTTVCAVSSRTYPAWPFAKARGVAPALAKRVAVALLQSTSGTTWTVPLDYQPVHDLFRELKIGPYARSAPVRLADLFKEYREWFIALGIALASWMVYSVRVEWLVRKRTRALSRTNAELSREMAERRRIEEEDRRHQRELEHVARLSILGEMATSIAHEMNQPLGAIASYGQAILIRVEGGRTDPQDMKLAAQQIVSQAERASLVVKRIRAFVSKSESQRNRVEIPELINECAALFESTTRQAGVRLELELAVDTPAVWADRIQLQQVVLNLVQNAVDAMEETPRDERLLTISTETVDDGVTLSVGDRGSGMDDTALAHFAKPFYTTKAKGIGMGLALSRSIVEAHKGRLWATRPQNDAGTQVKLWLPGAQEEKS